MFPTSTPSTSSKREISTPLNQVYSHEQLFNNAAGHTTSNNINNSNAVPPPTTARTYKTRERLYYETDYVKAPNSPINNTDNSSNSALFEPFVRKQGGGAAGNNIEELSADELPPTASLHDNLLPTTSTTNTASSNNNNFSNLCTGSPMVINGVIGSPMKSFNNYPNMESSQFAPFVIGGQQQLTRAVTVFGFPPNLRNEILLSFQLHGPIESFDVSGGDGSNWIHIVYESEWPAQKALNRNGSVFQPSGSMIGVIPMQTALEKVNNAADSFMSPIKKKTFDTTNNVSTSIFMKKEKKSDEINLSSFPTESSLVTKAVNYIFGW